MPEKNAIALCLEGLSVTQFHQLAARLPNLSRLLWSGSLAPIAPMPGATIYPYWAEILWGKPWHQLGIAGYSKPRSSLNDVVPIQENDSPDLSSLSDSQLRTISVNIPFLTPQENRYWLSDGSLPLSVVVSPPALADRLPFKKYKPRPFSSAPYGLARIPSSVTDCLEVEKVRLQCASELIQPSNWDRCLIRLTAFDHLAHLLGVDYLSNEGSIFFPELLAFLKVLDDWFATFASLQQKALTFLFSSVGHTGCRGRVNLNKLLMQGGFCQLNSEKKNSSGNAARRQSITQTLNDDHTVGAEPLLVTPQNTFDSSGTVCGSTSQGAVYVNRKSRFTDGLVEEDEVSQLVSEISTCIYSTLKKSFGIGPKIWLNQDRASTAPELLVDVAGIEFHNSSFGPAVDTTDMPRSTHSSDGFVWLPESGWNGSVSALQLHHRLVDARHD